MVWHDVTKLLEERIGLNAESVGTALIESASQRRLTALGLEDPAAYAGLLRSSAGELLELIEEIVISESWFFRDGRPFEHLQEVARAFWRTSSLPFRVLSVPCAGGEEAYSIAIALLEIAAPGERFQIDAVDISARRLAQARRGVYSRNAFRSPLSEQRAGYFRSCPAGMEVTEAVRGHVSFMQGNLLDADFLKEQPPYDAVWCRNLLIYLTEQARQQVMATLDRLLKAEGTLYVGHAETLALLEPRFTPAADRASFALRRTPTPAVTGPAVIAGKNKDEATAVPQRPARPIARPTLETPATLTSRVPVKPTPVAAPAGGDPDSAITEALRLADRNQHADAIRLLESLMREQGPSARAYALLGMIDLATGQVERAEMHLLKAVYLNAADEESLLALALICQRRGDQDGAERYRSRARRARQAKEAS